jgi:heat shock protein HslJ
MSDNMKYKLLLLSTLIYSQVSSQSLKPGFDPDEYRQLLYVSARIVESQEYQSRFPQPEGFVKIYRSPELGLDNLWELWLDKDRKMAVISIRGTSPTTESWLLNFYAAMIPAKGVIRWGPDSAKQEFNYQLSEIDQAAVHAGWMVGTALLYQDIKPRLDSLYALNVKDYFIVGHSQGGGIAYLLTAWLQQSRRNGLLPADICWKTYCSAAPKPGNLPFAYSYEAMTQNGWAFNVVNAKDWVPEVPFSVQTLDDFNPTNPFVNVDEILDQQKLSRRVVIKHIYNKLDKPTRKAQKNFEKFLGNMTQKLVEESIPGLEVPAYVHSNNYVRTGIQIVLMPDAEYYEQYPDGESANSFTHHRLSPYLYLVNRLNRPFYQGADEAGLEGMWVLKDMPGEAVTSESFENGNIPTMQIHLHDSTLTGNGGCNSFGGKFSIRDERFVAHELTRTLRYCGEKNREPDFFSSLQGKFEYAIENHTLYFMQHDQIILTFERSLSIE